MKNTLYKLLGCALLLAAPIWSSHAENGILETITYKICPGDTLSITVVDPNREVVVQKDTFWQDTIRVADPTQDSIYRFVVNVYPRFEKTETKRIPLGDSILWQGKYYSNAGKYIRTYTSIHGCDSIYRLNLETYRTDTVDTLFTLCDDESLTFLGKTFVNAGTYLEKYSDDTLYNITIVKHPGQLHLQTGVLDRTHPYYWQYMLDGEAKTDTISQPGVYEYTSLNTTTGCNDTWRLVLTKDETSYHFIETVTVCENEEFDWHGLTGLNKTGIGQTLHYFDRHRTAADQDSIYELVLTVNPVPRRTQTITFCSSIEWGGKTYTKSQTIIDTLHSVRYNCDSIVTTILQKGIPVTFRDTVHILSGETLTWHGRTITQPGSYQDVRPSSFGCDSTYMLEVILTEAAHELKTRSEWQSICQGEDYEWRNKTYYNSGTYYDTIKAGGEIDSLYILYLTVNKSYALNERIGFVSFPVTYRDSLITQPGEYVFSYRTVHGCDSIITTYIDQDVYNDIQTVTICPGESHIWTYNGERYTTAGTYVQTERTKDGLHDSIMHVLHLNVNYIPETYLTQTICKGDQYTFADSTLTTSGVYRHTFHTAGGCDSTVVLSLNVLNPDTSYTIIQRAPGATYEWNQKTYYQPGIYYFYGKNQNGCDSVAVLNFTYNQIDTIADTLTVCPSELPFVWNGIEANQTKHYTRTVQQPNGTVLFYSLYLKVRDVVEKDTTFAVCEGGSIQFNGETYNAAGYYRSYLGCDTLMNVHIIVHQPAVYETRGTVTDEHGFTWSYIDHGVPGQEEFTTPGTYEFVNPNPETGCNDIYRLILYRDEKSYHIEESLTICEGDDFWWYGKQYPSNVTGTTTYVETYETRAGKDSIFTLHLTVTPVERTVRTVVFCDEIEWNGKTYTNDAVVYDTTSLPTGCYLIERINLDKAMPFYNSESRSIPQGTVLHWHGQNITTDGTYHDYQTTVHGCDSIYELTVTIIPAAPQSNHYAEELSACEGDTILWRGNNIWRSGTYVDTVWTSDPVLGNVVDSIFSLHFTAWPAPKDTIYEHLYTCGAGALIRYQGKDYYEDQAVVAHLHTIHGCDSVVKVFMHFNTALFLSDTVKIADKELPYTWTYRLTDTIASTELNQAGTYNHSTPAEGGCTNREQLVLVVYPTYLYELDTTVCETALPFLWRGMSLQHTVGETRQYEDALYTENQTDSIYRVNLTIVPAPRRTERIEICENKDTLINGKSYFNNTDYPVGIVFHDTVHKLNADNECDSIIYYEITKLPQRRILEERVLHAGESFEWRGLTISEPVTKTYTIEDEIDPETGCEIIYQLHVVNEDPDFATLCALDTPYLWRGEKYYTTGVYTDTVFDETSHMTEFHSLNLNVLIPEDTLIVLRGCLPEGVTWNGVTYLQDTVFRDTLLTCDLMYTVKIHVDNSYSIAITDTICEQSLPYILGRQNPDTIWSECVAFPHTDKTACGCDSTVYLTLRIIPDLRKNDSTFICEDDIKAHPVVLGQLEDPWFAHREGGKYSEAWQGKWKGVAYTTDTIVYNCDSSYFHHIIVRPSQKTIPEKTFYLCPDDSLQLFWPYDTTWFSHDTTYLETRPMDSVWVDEEHGYRYENNSYTCDSVTRWYIKKLPRIHKDTTAHRLIGDSIWWGGRWRDRTGTYDSIGPSLTDTNSLGIACQYEYSLHLIMDTAYYFRDTISICSKADETHRHVWSETGYKQDYTVGKLDEDRHYIDSFLTYDRRDSIYDLYVHYTRIYETHLYDTICNGAYRYWYEHHADGTRTTHALHYTGTYYDTVPGTNLCDSILILHLFVRDPVRSHTATVNVADRALPYLWSHSWRLPDGRDSTYVDSLWASGQYKYTMPNQYGCDSIDNLTLHVHKTYRIPEDSIVICQSETPYTWQDRNDITETGTYTFYGLTSEGYDSTRYVHIEVLPVPHTIIEKSICRGHAFDFDGATLTETGTYADTLNTTRGCDSIVTLYLTVHEPYFHTIVEHVIEGQEVHFFDTVCKTSGTYYHYGVTPTGCDSTTELQLFVHQLVDTTVTVCSTALPYLWVNKWNGQVTPLYTAGIYRNDTVRIDGERMFYGLQLIVDEPTDTVIYREICEGDSYNFNGRFLEQAGEYRDTIRNISGCDSVVILHLNVLSKYYHTVERMIYEGDSVEFQGEFYSIAGNYPVHFNTSYGCDSIVELRLTVRRLFDDSVTICANELPLLWRNRTIYESGIYRDTTYADGKEVVTGLKVNVLPTVRAAEPVVFSMCDGDFYKFGNRILTEQGTYYDTLTAVNGCDSIVMLSLQVLPTGYQSEVVRIFEGDSALFHGEWYKESGVYEYREKNAGGCTETYQMILTVLKSFYTDTTAVICDNELPFTWRGYEYNESGDYSLPIAWTDSSRVVKTLHLTVRETFYGEQNISICAGDTFLFKGKQYYESGFIMDTIPSQEGCDSIVKYIIHIHPTFDKVFEQHISDKEPFTFHERVLTQTGTYEWTGKTVNGCDSIEHLILTVHPSFFQSDTIHLCQSDSANYPYKWKDTDGRLIATISQSGVYNDSVLTAYGFDSVHQLVVYVHPSYLINEQYEIGDGEVLKIHGKTISNPMIYLDTMRTVHGCDSIFHVVVNAKRTREFTWTKTICQGDYFEWLDGRKLTTTGSYRYVSQYKDSIVYLNLTVNPTTYSEKRIVVTDKTTSYIYDGKLYENLHLGENLFTESYVNQYGCDSIRRFIICVTTHYSEWYPMALCPGSELKIDGRTITEAGLYTFERRSRVTGEMDSLYRVEVYDAPAYDFKPDSLTICQGDSVEYAGKFYKKPGEYTIKYKTVDGCDSIHYLHLTVNPVYLQEETVKLLDDEVPYIWEGEPYYMSGDYIRSWQVNECDDTHILHLTVVEPQYIPHTATICNGDSMYWRGDYYALAGDYYSIARDTINKIKTIYTLHLETVFPTEIISAHTTDICADAESFDIEFEYNGTKPTHYSVYFDALAKHEGFTDIVDAPFLPDMMAHVDMPQYTEIAYNNHPIYVRPNKYTMRLVVDNSVCGVSSSNNIEITVKYPSWIIEQHWNDVVAPLKKAYNGGFEFSEVDWYVNGALQPNNSLGYLHNDKLKEGDEVVMYATRKGENYAIPTCPLVIKAILPNTTDEPILVYPTQAPHMAPAITIEAPQGGEYEVYSFTGMQIEHGQLGTEPQQIMLPTVSGIYFIRTKHGQDSQTHKVLLY